MYPSADGRFLDISSSSFQAVVWSLIAFLIKDSFEVSSLFYDSLELPGTRRLHFLCRSGSLSALFLELRARL